MFWNRVPLFCKEDPVLPGQVTEKQGAERVWLPLPTTPHTGATQRPPSAGTVPGALYSRAFLESLAFIGEHHCGSQPKLLSSGHLWSSTGNREGLAATAEGSPPCLQCRLRKPIPTFQNNIHSCAHMDTQSQTTTPLKTMCQ